ncbi:hypothetical protein GF314_01860 [bacterium]|nr:hypothetical protein [bacterium]
MSWFVATQPTFPEAVIIDPIHVPQGRVEPIDLLGVQFTAVITAEQTGGTFSIFEEITPPGMGPPLHIHHAEEEFFRVLAGRYRFQLPQQPRSLPRAGDRRGVLGCWPR